MKFRFTVVNLLFPLVSLTRAVIVALSIVKDKWKKQIYEKNPNLKKITVHGLRHSFATIANDNGWNMVDVKNVLGHKSLDLTLGTYTHTTKNGEEEIRKDINGLF